MGRENLRLKYFQRKSLLSVKNSKYREHLKEFFNWLIKSDDTYNDASIRIMKKNINSAEIIGKQSGIIAGVEEVGYLLNQFSAVRIQESKKDGELIENGNVFMTIVGNNTELIMFERIILNILGRMSGIATQTSILSSQIAKISSSKIAATRKTPLALMDKKAVGIGGGLTHRLNLSDWVMIKDNHLRIIMRENGLSQEDSIKWTIKQMFENKIQFFEIEVESVTQAEIALITFLNLNEKSEVKISMAVLLDNFTPEAAKSFILKQRNARFSENIIYEVSGGIKEKNIKLWAETNADILSLGVLTNSAESFDLSMRIN